MTDWVFHGTTTRRARWNRVVWVPAAVVVLTGCGSALVPTSVAVRNTPAPSSSSTRAAPSPATSTVVRPHVAPTKALPPFASTGTVVNAAGAVLPNPRRTPGAINPSVTQATIHSTICVPGWTATIRPDSGYTTALKTRQLATGYAYHDDRNPGDYEEDHLISLELGGSPEAATNLWPEPYFATDGARTKDRIENRLHSLVCSGLLSLARAQHAIAANWWVAYRTYAAVSSAPMPARTRHTSVAPAPVAAGGGATARCNDGTYSYAAHHQGACSHHGGVEIFYP